MSKRSTASRRPLPSSAASLVTLQSTRDQMKKKRREAIEDTINLIQVENFRSKNFELKMKHQERGMNERIRDIKVLKDEIKKIQNRRKMNKTMSLNNPVLHSAQKTDIPRFKNLIAELEAEVEIFKHNIKILKKGSEKANNKINTLTRKLRVQNLSMGGRRQRKNRTSKRR